MQVIIYKGNPTVEDWRCIVGLIEKGYIMGIDRPSGIYWKTGDIWENLSAKLSAKIAEAEQKAQTSHGRRKYIMYGYWKAIAVHLRKVKRELLKGV